MDIDGNVGYMAINNTMIQIIYIMPIRENCCHVVNEICGFLQVSVHNGT